MKSLFKHLVIILLIALCAGFYSCDDGTLDVAEQEFAFMDGDSFQDYGISTKGIECRDSKRDPIGRNHFSGLKDNHLWISTYDRTTKEKLFEWTDTRTFNRTRNVHVGYGEYKDVTASRITTYGTCEKENGFVVAYAISFGGEYTETNILFKHPLGIKEIKPTNIALSNLGVHDWYKESVIIDNCCYNCLGDTLFTTSKSMRITSAIIPISYEEGIYSYYDNQSFNINKGNFKEEKAIWNIKVTLPFEIPSNAKTTYSISDKSTKVWKYILNVVYYDGTKKDFTFSINIETGTIIGEELPISYANLKGTWDMTKCYGWEYNGDGVKEDWEEDVTGEYIFFESTHGNGGYFDGSKTNYFASSLQGNKLILEDSNWLVGKSITITKLTATELHITATEASSVENYEMKKR